MADWRWAILALAAAWGLQALLTYRQILHYRATLRELYSSRPEGYLGVGVRRRPWRAGTVVVLVAGPDGVILDGRLLSGATVFARFRPTTVWNGRRVHELAAPQVPPASPADQAAAEAASQILARMAEGR